MSEKTLESNRVAWAYRITRPLVRAFTALQQNRWALLVGGAALAILVAGGVVWMLGQQRQSDEAVTHTFDNEKQLARVLSLLQDAEIGQRGFLLTGDAYYLGPYNQTLGSVTGELEQLAQGLSGNAGQQANVAVLRTLATQKMSELRQTIDRRRNGDAAGALLLLQNGQGKLLMDGIREVVARMQVEEARLMEQNSEIARRSVIRIEIAMVVLLLACLALTLASARSTLRRAKSAEASRDELLSRFDRKLMAVLAADVIGYSRMMERDEAGTLMRLMALRERVDPLIGRHGGRITGTAGDSLLAVFPSALSAVDCAIEMQMAGAENASDGIMLRIGINVGDVITQGNDVFGDAVNIAARLEGLASPGGICVSRAVRDHVGKQRHVAFTDLGPQTVKNIAEPVSAHAISV